MVRLYPFKEESYGLLFWTILALYQLTQTVRALFLTDVLRVKPMNMDATFNLYQRFWNHAQSAIFVVNTHTGQLHDLNPAAERLSGYTKTELLNKPYYCLHPSEDHGHIKSLFIDCNHEKCLVTNIHLLTKDQRLIPIEISSSGQFEDAGHVFVIGIVHDMSEKLAYENQLAAKNWALSAYSSAVIALGHSTSSDTLMHAICEAIVQESTYVLAWIGMAEELDGKPVSIEAAAGSALGYVESINISSPMAMGLPPKQFALANRLL